MWYTGRETVHMYVTLKVTHVGNFLYLGVYLLKAVPAEGRSLTRNKHRRKGDSDE